MVDTDGVITASEFYEHLQHAEMHLTDEGGSADAPSSRTVGTSVGTEWLEVMPSFPQTGQPLQGHAPAG